MYKIRAQRDAAPLKRLSQRVLGVVLAPIPQAVACGPILCRSSLPSEGSGLRRFVDPSHLIDLANHFCSQGFWFQDFGVGSEAEEPGFEFTQITEEKLG